MEYVNATLTVSAESGAENMKNKSAVPSFRLFLCVRGIDNIRMGGGETEVMFLYRRA